MIFVGLFIILGAILLLADYIITHFGVYIITGIILFFVLGIIVCFTCSPRDEDK